MVNEALELLDGLAAAIEHARARRGPGHADSLQALEAIATAVATTRGYVERSSRMHDGSLEMARWSTVAERWLAASRLVLGLSLTGEEKKLAKAEGWLATRPWKRLEKEDGGWRLQTVLDHCTTLRAGFPAA